MNWAIEPDERARRDRVRMKLFVTMLVTYGYAILGAALWEPLTSGEFSSIKVLMVPVGLALHGLALYLSSQGET